MRNVDARDTIPVVMSSTHGRLGLAIVFAAACVQPPPYDTPSAPTTRTEPVRAPATAPARAINTPPLDVAPDSVARRRLVDVRLTDPTIMVDAKYATADNFTGAPLPGYEANRAMLRREVAAALARVQRRARYEGVALKIYDAYRPVRATQAMVDWTERTGRTSLLRDGYIASRSRHNLGVAVDLTLVGGNGRELDMGTPFDTFTSAAHTANATGEVAANRALLVRLMQSEGFTNYDKEWWHFSYDVPEAERYDLVIR
jgi:D-alanyl-D-alanine dipeptidase